jgi:hypothetical protein
LVASFPIFLLSFFSIFSSFLLSLSFTFFLPSRRPVRPCVSFYTLRSFPALLSTPTFLLIRFLLLSSPTCALPALHSALRLHTMLRSTHTYILSRGPISNARTSWLVFYVLLSPLCFCFPIQSLNCFGAALQRRGGVPSHLRCQIFSANNPENLLGKESRR